MVTSYLSLFAKGIHVSPVEITTMTGQFVYLIVSLEDDVVNRVGEEGVYVAGGDYRKVDNTSPHFQFLITF